MLVVEMSTDKAVINSIPSTFTYGPLLNEARGDVSRYVNDTSSHTAIYIIV